MAKRVLDYFFSAPADSNGDLNRAIPTAPTRIRLAEFGLKIPQNVNQVDLKATVGWSAVAGRPNVQFKIIRGNNQVIYSTTDEIDITVIEDKTVTFTAVDINVPAGQTKYAITVELTNPEGALNQAAVTGPVTFSGTAYGNI
ncbi:hypothetical protein [Pseudalkalibacillus sp. SCS-8]|uniref:hypothetical protein n=1 Tax=Pseudalkalibacillus nanhaiensis TaxID=3115291 RepID=UPI0032DB4839